MMVFNADATANEADRFAAPLPTLKVAPQAFRI